MQFWDILILKKVFIFYLKFKLNWTSRIFRDNHRGVYHSDQLMLICWKLSCFQHQIQSLGNPFSDQPRQLVTLSIDLCGLCNLNFCIIFTILLLLIFFQPCQNMKNIFSSQDVQKQAAGWIWSVVSSWLTWGLDHSWFIPWGWTYCYSNKMSVLLTGNGC